MSEYLAATDLEVANQGCVPTFCVGNKRTVIDVTLVTRTMTREIYDWRVASEDSFSDHRMIQFNIQQCKRQRVRCRNIRRTNWTTYELELCAKTGMWFASIKSPDDIERELTKLNSAIITSYEKACPERKNSGRAKVPWWSHELKQLRQKANKAFHKAYKSRDEKDWNAHRASRRAFKSALRRSKRHAWRNFCTELEGVHESSRLYKALGYSSKGKLGMLLLPNGKWTANLEEAYAHLLDTHFPGSRPACNPRATRSNKSTVLRYCNNSGDIITPDRVEWAINTMAPYKSPGLDGIYPVLLQRGLQYLLDPLCQIYQASLALGYIPQSWREARVTFIPKPGKADYTTAKAFRPISLTSFLLKGLEKIVDRYLRDGPLINIPIHPRQHAFQAGKSTECALHHIVSRIEKAFDANEYALGVFFDIQGAFDNTSVKAVKQALVQHNVPSMIHRWISALIGQRFVSTKVGQVLLQIITNCGLPQGGGLSPTLWSLVADSLLEWLSAQGVFGQGFADDGTILLVGRVMITICEIMQRILSGVERWCNERQLSVNPEKTEMILFTRRYKPDKVCPISFYGTELTLSTSVKYLGVHLDSKLNWKIHVDSRYQKAITSFYHVRRVTGKTWGLSPKVIRWIYTAIVRPMVAYGAAVWWPRADQKTVSIQLDRVQRLVCLYITGAVRTTPTSALEIIVGLTPLTLYIKQEAMLACYRLKTNFQWSPYRVGHASVQTLMELEIPASRLRNDHVVATYIFDKNYVVTIPSKEAWNNQNVEILDVICFTDGSRHQRLGQTGAGVYIQTSGVKLAIPLGKYATVFQAEMYAIRDCICNINSQEESSVAICSDSQAVLKTLRGAKTTSNLVKETILALKALSVSHSVRLLWVPGHCGVEGNEIADVLAKQAACLNFVGPEPVLGLPNTLIRTYIRQWADKEQTKRWQTVEGCRQTKMFLHGPDKRLTHFALGLRKHDLRILVGLFTGHCTLNRHLAIMHIQDDPLCPACGEEEETPLHLLGKCCATMQTRYCMLGAYTLQLEELCRISPSSLLRFAKASLRL